MGETDEGKELQGNAFLYDERSRLLYSIEALAQEIARRPDSGDLSTPVQDLKRLCDLGVYRAALRPDEGGLGLGTSEGQPSLLRILAAVGGADLVLGRLIEGHINALTLIDVFGSTRQKTRAAQDARDGLLFGVWNTGAPELLRIERAGKDYLLRGLKTFASGATLVERPIVTAEAEAGWQMVLPRMRDDGVHNAVRINRDSWHPLGMEASESYEIDFTGVRVRQEDLIGSPGDFYRDPLFSGGAVRFAAVHAGAIIQLHAGLARWLQNSGRESDPYQIARLGETALLAREAALWVERAGSEATRGFAPDAPKHAGERMVEFANAMRVAIERAATESIRLISAGVGARGLLRPHRFGRMLRDLTMYLRQPAPDQVLASVGRAALRNLNMRSAAISLGLWSDGREGATIPSSYFEDVYARSTDPWSFETSAYEKEKYKATLCTLPREQYASGLELGCSIGVLTESLAERCLKLLGVDVSAQALQKARERCAGLAHVAFEQKQFPQEMPDGCFDLILVSEVAYYWDQQDLQHAADLLAERQPKGGQLLLVHFTEFVPDYPLTGDQVHEMWLRRPEWRHVTGRRMERYRIDLLERCGA